MKQISKSIKIKASKGAKWIVICYQITFIFLYLIYYHNPSGASHPAIMIALWSQFPTIILMTYLFDVLSVDLNGNIVFILIVITQCVFLFFLFKYVIQRLLLEKEENGFLADLRSHKS